jgi:hypothetical protein
VLRRLLIPPRDLSRFGKVDSAESHLRLLRRRREQGTGYGVRHVVMTARSMVDAVTARARGAAFEADQLGDQPLVAEQPDLPRIDVRQQIEIEDALGIHAEALLGDPLQIYVDERAHEESEFPPPEFRGLLERVGQIQLMTFMGAR